MSSFQVVQRSLRIGLLAPPWIPVPPTRYGGTESVIDRLARGLVRQGHEVLVWTTGDATCPVLRGWHHERADRDRLGATTVEISHVARGYEAFYEWQADIVHDHTLLGPLLHAGDVPIVTTNHGPFADGLDDLYEVLSPRVPIVAISADQARRAGGIAVSAVIHHGIDLDDFPQGAGLGDAEGPYVLFLGRATESKGVHIAARVAARAGLRLIIAAKIQEPEEHAYFETAVRPLLGNRLVYVGEVGPLARLRLLQGATALLNPIQWPEPFGLVMIEALACGTPVVAFARGAATEIVEDGVTGFLAANEEEMVKLVGHITVLDRARCRRSVELRFATDRMVDDHISFYRRIVAGDRPRWRDDIIEPDLASRDEHDPISVAG